MRLSLGLFLGAAAVAAATAAGWALWPSSSTGHADPDDARQVALGKEVYRHHCASCHGATLEGQADWRTRNPEGRLPAPPHDETGHTWHHPDEHLFQITQSGLKPPLAPKGYVSDMPAFSDILTEEEIWAVLAFVKSNWPLDIRDRQSRLNSKARQ